MLKISTSKDSRWRPYWGSMPLPAGAEALGTVTRDGETGALIRLKNGRYVQGNAGGIKTLPQREVADGLARSELARSLGKIKSPAREAASKENWKRRKFTAKHN